MVTIKNLFVSLTLLALSIFVNGQEKGFELLGTVRDSSSLVPMGQVNIILRDSVTDKFIAGTTTTNSGNFGFRNLSESNYFLTFSYIGYKRKTTKIELFGEKKLQYLTTYLSISPFELMQIDVTEEPLLTYDYYDNLTINLEQIGDVDNLSVADILEGITGVGFNIAGKLVYNGYINFQTLIDGKMINNRARLKSAGGSYQKYELKQIPAKHITKVEILPEPQGKYGYYTPIINIIPKGGLKNYTTYNGKIGYNQKYGLSAGTTSNSKKFTLNPSIAIDYNTSWLNKDEERRSEDYNTRYKRSFFDESINRNAKANLVGYYSFSSSHYFKVDLSSYMAQINKSSRRETHFYLQEKLFTNNNIITKPFNNNVSIAYRNSISLNAKERLSMDFKIQTSKNKEEGEEDNLNEFNNKNDSFYQWNNSTISNNLDAKIDYYNHKGKFHYLILSSFSFLKDQRTSKREILTNESSWVEQSFFAQDVGLKRIKPELGASLIRRIESNDDSFIHNHFLKLTLRETFLWEKIIKNHNNIETNTSSYDTHINFLYQARLHLLGHLGLNISSSIHNPTSNNLLNTPIWIDEYSYQIGKSNLNSERSRKVTLSYSWNAPGTLILNRSLKHIKKRNIGYSVGINYSQISNKILDEFQLNEDGVLIQSFSNIDKLNNLTFNGNLSWRITPKGKVIYEANVKSKSWINNENEIDHNFYWESRISMNLTINKYMDFNVRYSYYSGARTYQVEKSPYHDASMNLVGTFFKEKVLFSLDVSNLLAFQGRSSKIVGDGFIKEINHFYETPLLLLSASMNVYKFYKNK